MDPFPVYYVWKILFITRGKRVWDIDTVSVVAEHHDVAGPIDAFLQTLGGRGLPGAPEASDIMIASWRGTRLLWQRQKPDNREIRTRIDLFEYDRNGAYFVAIMLLFILGATFIAAQWWPVTSYWVGGLFLLYGLLMFLIHFLTALQWVNDLKRIGIAVPPKSWTTCIGVKWPLI